MFAQMEEAEQQRVLSSQQSFSDWFRECLYSVYTKIENSISNVWDWLCGLF